MAKLFIKGTKVALHKKWFRRLLLTAAAALILMVSVDFLASVIREMVAYHTMGTYVATVVGINAFLSRKKLTRIAKKLVAMGNEDEKISSPAPGRTSFADVAQEFAAAVNGAHVEEEVFED